MATPIPNNVIRPPKQLNRLSKHDLDVIEIEQLEQEIAKKQEELKLKKAAIAYTPEKFKGRIWLNDIMAAVCRYCLLYTSPSPRDGLLSRMPSSA